MRPPSFDQWREELSDLVKHVRSLKLHFVERTVGYVCVLDAVENAMTIMLNSLSSRHFAAGGCMTCFGVVSKRCQRARRMKASAQVGVDSGFLLCSDGVQTQVMQFCFHACLCNAHRYLANFPGKLVSCEAVVVFLWIARISAIIQCAHFLKVRQA